ncbi:MAG: site-specific DNA-methyltransferase, partial [Alphaproteobacteria bacterium]|nr:site-specific DNA-methyltransferase [Alphaproteobacteria bacterium]
MNVLDQRHGKDWTAYNADCVEVLAGMPSNSLDFSVYSPPFSSLYIYSESERDMGNVDGDEAFQAAYAYVVRELLRATKPGRLTAIHVKDLVYYSNASDKGDRGLRDFTGECIRTHVDAGWSYHSRVTIWRCPVKEMQKAKPDGLLFKNFRTDAARNRQGLPEYLVVFRKWAEGMDETAPVVHDPAHFPLDTWQQWASPVWMDMRETDVLNARVARDDQAEKHLCPMPLDITERAIRLWTNPGDVVCSPFMG